MFNPFGYAINKKIKLTCEELAFSMCDKAAYLWPSHPCESVDLSETRNILIIGFTGIGDTIMFTPVFRYLKKYAPDAKITFITSPNGTSEIVEGSSFVDRVITFDFYKASWRQRLQIAQVLKKKDFDCTLTIYPGLGYPRALFAFWTGADIRVGHEYKVGRYTNCGLFYNIKLPNIENQHKVESNLNLVRALGLSVDEQDREMLMYIADEDRIYAQQFLNELCLREGEVLIGMHTGSVVTGAGKRWPLERFASLADRLIQEYQARIMLFFGPDEQELANEIVNLMVEQPIIVKGLTLRRVAALIQQCSVFVSTDSALGHIAAALQIPTVAIFGPGTPVRTRPYGKQHVVITHELECSPCFDKPRFFTCTHRKCLSLITVDEVFQAVGDIIAQKEHEIAKSTISSSLQSIL